MGKTRKRQQAKRARTGAGPMEIDGAPKADAGVVSMDTSEGRTSGLLGQNKKNKIQKRRAVQLRKKKAVVKAVAMNEKTQEKLQQDASKQANKNSMKALY